MADAPDDIMLREMARHRGLKLVKSRRRKPGSGDYGKFGLTDDKGAELLGFGKNGLTASAADIADYLRRGEASTWAQSVESVPAGAPAPPAPEPEKEAQAPVRKKRPPKARASPPAKAAPPALPAPPPEAKLRIRAAGKGDGEGLARLVRSIGGDADAAEIEDRLGRLRRAGSPVMVAERGALVGCLAWQRIEPLQAPSFAHISMIAVEEGARRKGIGRALVEAARAAMEKAGCTGIEAISPIEIRSAHGFFRELGFERTAYRFWRAG